MNITEALLNLPWTIVRRDETYDGEASVELSVEELPGFLVCGATDDEVGAAFWPALTVFV